MACDQNNRGPVAIESSPPIFPEFASRLCIEGAVVAEFKVQLTGKVSDVRISSSDPNGVFDHATKVLENWRFSPACQGGNLVEALVVQEFEFALPEQYKESCPDQIDGKATETLLSIAQLFANVWGQLIDQGPRDIKLPAIDFTNDEYGQIVRFHYQTLQGFVDFLQSHDSFRVRQLYIELFNAERINRDRSFSGTRKLLSELDGALIEEEYNASINNSFLLLQRITQLKSRLNLEDEVFNFLVSGTDGLELISGLSALFSLSGEVSRHNEVSFNKVEFALELLHKNRLAWQLDQDDPRLIIFNDQQLQSDFLHHIDSAKNSMANYQIETFHSLGF